VQGIASNPEWKLTSRVNKVGKLIMKTKRKSLKSRAAAQKKRLEDEKTLEQKRLLNLNLMKNHRIDPDFREKENKLVSQQKRKRKLKESYHEKVKLDHSQRMATIRKENDSYRKTEKTKDAISISEKRACAEKRALENEKRILLKEKRLQDKEIRALERQKDRLRKRKERANEIYRFHKDLESDLERRKITDMFAKVKLDTYRNINVVPNSICALCNWLAFRKSVSVLHIDRLLKAYNSKAKKIENAESFKEKFISNNSQFICRTCYQVIREGRIPTLHKHSGLELKSVHPDVACLNFLEEKHVSPILPMTQILDMTYKSPFPSLGCKGPIINVESDINQMCEILPRKMNDLDVVQVEWRRKLEYKTNLAKENIYSAKICRALKILIDTPLYKNLGIRVDQDAMEAFDLSELGTQHNFILPPCMKTTEVNQEKETSEDFSANLKLDCDVKMDDLFDDFELNEEEMEHIFEDERAEIEEHDALKELGYCQEIMMRKNLDIEQFLKKQEEMQIIAPGEGKPLVSSCHYPHYIELCFPTLYCGQPVETNVSLNKRMKFEIRHYDRRFAKPRTVLLFKTQD
jgi:hypothetical protein